jgi:IS30 family transposase
MDRKQRAEIAEELYAEGLTCNEIGQRLGVVASTVSKDLKRRGVKMRPAPHVYQAQRLAGRIKRARQG